MFRTHLLRERYRVRREILRRHEIWKKKKRRKRKFEEIKDYVVAGMKTIRGKIRRIVLSQRQTKLERTSISESLPREREIEENNYFIKDLHLKRCLYLESHLPQVGNRASNDKIADIEFVR